LEPESDDFIACLDGEFGEDVILFFINFKCHGRGERIGLHGDDIGFAGSS